MKTAFKCKKVVSRKQWRYLKLLLDDLGETEYDLKRCEYTRTELLALLSVDYESLPERTSDPTATPRNKQGLAQVACACGCGALFVSKGGYHKYADPTHRKSKPKKTEAARKDYALVAGTLILVDPAMDHYETRAL